jgi:hypothetical protein
MISMSRHSHQWEVASSGWHTLSLPRSLAVEEIAQGRSPSPLPFVIQRRLAWSLCKDDTHNQRERSTFWWEPEHGLTLKTTTSSWEASADGSSRGSTYGGDIEEPTCIFYLSDFSYSAKSYTCHATQDGWRGNKFMNEAFAPLFSQEEPEVIYSHLSKGEYQNNGGMWRETAKLARGYLQGLG